MSIELLEYFKNGVELLSLEHIDQIFTASSTSFLVIAVAELGDKSQLVCMTLATRHKPIPVILGAGLAFALLNVLAVLFGAVVSNWFPDYVIAAVVCLLFGVFGVHTLFARDDDDEKKISKKTSHGIFFTTFLLITFAEFGDKTQLAVAALSSSINPYGVWIGATLAEIMISIIGVIAGRTILQTLKLTVIHWISGIIFMVLAAIAGFAAYEGIVHQGLIDWVAW